MITHTSVALLRKSGEVVLGVIYDDELFVANSFNKKGEIVQHDVSDVFTYDIDDPNQIHEVSDWFGLIGYVVRETE